MNLRVQTSFRPQEAFFEYKKIPIQFSEIDMLQSIELSAKLQIYAYAAKQCGVKTWEPLL